MNASSHDAGPSRRPSTVALVAGAVGLVALMVAGVLVLGRLAGSDVQAIVLTTVFLVVVGAVVLWLTRRRRAALVVLGGTYAVVAGIVGVLLGLPLVTDDVVDEDVVRVEAAPAGEETAGAADGAEPDGTGTRTGTGTGTDAAAGGSDGAAEAAEPAGPVALAAGGFADRDHPGTGTATLVETAEGPRVLTLTEFATDNGPDLFVYLVPPDAPEGSVDGFVDLGRLKGNQGDQQYDVPDDVAAGAGWRVVVWCRAFAVTFTEATLA